MHNKLKSAHMGEWNKRSIPQIRTRKSLHITWKEHGWSQKFILTNTRKQYHRIKETLHKVELREKDEKSFLSQYYIGYNKNQYN